MPSLAQLIRLRPIPVSTVQPPSTARCQTGLALQASSSWAVARLVGVSLVWACALGVMRLMRPLRTCRGRIRGSGLRRRRAWFRPQSIQRTGLQSWATRLPADGIRVAAGFAGGVLHHGNGCRAEFECASSASSCLRAGSMRAQWEGTDIFSGRARLAPACLHSVIARLTAGGAASPAMTVWPGEL